MSKKGIFDDLVSYDALFGSHKKKNNWQEQAKKFAKRSYERAKRDRIEYIRKHGLD